MSGEIHEGGSISGHKQRPHSARARRTTLQPAEIVPAPPIIPGKPESETQEPLVAVQEALEQAHRNLVVWHDSLIDSNPQLFKRDEGLLPVISNGKTINYN